MGIGIQICGLNGCGKSTLGQALAKQIGFHFIDNENLYFSRTTQDAPYAHCRSRAEAEQLLLQEINRHENFVFAAVRGDYGSQAPGFYTYVVLLEVPKATRAQRIRTRSFEKFGSRMLPGGELHDSEEAFFSICDSREETYATNWLQNISCPVIRLDGTRPVEENIARLRQLMQL